MKIPIYWTKAKQHLSKKDKRLSKIIQSHEGALSTRNNPFYSLCKSIVGQQISVQAADSVWSKLSKKCKRISPNRINELKKTELLQCGLSRQKVKYIRLLSKNFLNKKFSISKLKKMNDQDAIKYLCANKGIGVWTAEMFLMFNQNRPNIFPEQDIGLLKAISKNYKTDYPPTKEQLKRFKKKWEPYCSVATWYLWRSIDPVAVEY
tara:strand:- start:605 stop:1222 length:618 start_codon:yes stop_codon:yes gene_type:complete